MRLIALASLVPYGSSSASASGDTEEDDEACGLAVDSPVGASHLRRAGCSRAVSGPAAQLSASLGAAPSANAQQRERSFAHRAGDYAVVVYIAGECGGGSVRMPQVHRRGAVMTWYGVDAVQVPLECDATLASLFEQVQLLELLLM